MKFQSIEIWVVSATPANPSAGFVKIYQKSTDGHVYQLTSSWVETDLTLTWAWISDWDYWDVVVSWSSSVLTVKEPALRKSETSVNNSPTFTVIDKFDTLQTNFYWNGTVALDTAIEAEWTGCMKLTLSTAWATWPRLTLASTTNFLKKAFTIKCRATAWANIASAEILFATEAWFSNYYLWQWKGATNPKLVTPPDNEWIERVFNPWDCAVGAGTPNWYAITHIIVRWQASSGTPDLFVDDFQYFGSTQKPFVCVTYDDGLLTQFTNWKAKLDQYNIKWTFYVIHNELTPWTNMETSHHDILSSQGHDISWHGWTNLTSISESARLADLRAMKKYLLPYRWQNNYALPNWAYNDAVLKNVKGYFNSIANIDWLSNTKEYSPNYLVNRFSPDSGTSTATIQAWIDNAIAHNNMCIIAWHGIVASGATGAQVNQSTYDTIMDYIGTKKASWEIDTWTLTDYYAIDIDENPIRLLWIADPETPPAWVWYLYGKTIWWRTVPKFKWPSWLDYALQSAFWQNSLYMWTPTTATAWVWMSTAWAWAGTYTTALPTTTNKYTLCKRGRWANVVTTTNQVLGQRNTEALFFRWASAWHGGFFFYARAGMDVWTNGGRFFAGMHSDTTVVSADPSALNNTVWFCVDAADNGAISFLTRWTVATKASTGLTFASNTWFDFFIFCAPNSSQYTWRIVNLQTWAEASWTATANLPTNTTLLTAWVLASNAALTTVTAIQLWVSKIYVETDY